jgi:carbon monoxide dehydrogenase subunit G
LERVGENEYKGVIKVKVGPIQGQFQGSVSLSDLQPPHSYKMTVAGRGPAGFVNGEGLVNLEDQGETTAMQYEGQAQIGGRLASVGQRLIDSTAKSLTRQALENIHKQVKAGDDVSTAAAATPVPAPAPAAAAPSAESQATPEKTETVYETPSQTQFALDVAKDVLDDLIPAEQRPFILAAGGLLIMFIVSEWWMRRLAKRVAHILEKRR